MCNIEQNAVPKIHPASREILPDDPLEMHAFEVPGDQELMLRLLIEEYARIGMGVDAVVELSQDPNYTAFYGLRQSLGESQFRRRVESIIARCGVIRVMRTETEPPSENLIQIELPMS
jgi:hypothetical protein